MRAQRRLELTAVECRERIVRHLRGRGGWVPLADLIPFLDELGCNRSSGDRYLRDLVLTGRVERTHADGLRGFRYRVSQ